MSRLSEVLAGARAEGRAALVGYLPAGYPSVEGSAEACRALVAGGCDVVEVGLPYSDPLMDGPVIQAAAEAALRAGTRTGDVVRVAGAVAATGAAALVMSYWNPVERYGVDRFADELAAAGGSGVITPDLTPDEGGAWHAATGRTGLDRIYLVAPSSTDERIAWTVQHCSGFVYAASTMGVTGARTSVAGTARSLVERVRRATDLPVCVGLGVSTAEQAAEVAGYADGVIVGSAFVRRLLDAERAGRPADGVEGVRALAEELAAGVRAAPRPAPA
ncbi:tryptophan synthase subunit alpha [Vallicoccus soli]|uniref:Tryptophan synthase alpha chain n=1 Tax=Vallicoccus soli TaxID=2339232 RepID=A0A3A3YTZ4_9ACTN|nr:tryptophan synthase subunit alpha [Vallicoccus soli]RJK93719.1 tryptophan synthase subunit alpha [Vallicoccus soli]